MDWDLIGGIVGLIFVYGWLMHRGWQKDAYRLGKWFWLAALSPLVYTAMWLRLPASGANLAIFLLLAYYFLSPVRPDPRRVATEKNREREEWHRIGRYMADEIDSYRVPYCTRSQCNTYCELVAEWVCCQRWLDLERYLPPFDRLDVYYSLSKCPSCSTYYLRNFFLDTHVANVRAIPGTRIQTQITKRGEQLAQRVHQGPQPMTPHNHVCTIHTETGCDLAVGEPRPTAEEDAKNRNMGAYVVPGNEYTDVHEYINDYVKDYIHTR